MTVVATTPAADRAIGLMRLDDALLALPVDVIREVVPGRAAYPALPVGAAGLRGAMDLRGTVIPVLDLRESLGMPARAAASQHAVVVMRWESRLLGLVVDEVCGMARVGAAALFALETAAGDRRPPLATHGVRLEQGVAALLDAGRIAALPDVPLVAEDTAEVSRQAGRSEPMLLFSYRGSHFGIGALHVDATVPRSAVKRGALTGGACLGTVDHHGFEVPVLDTLAALGVGPQHDPAETAVLVVRFADGMLGFALDEVRDIARVAASDVTEMPPLPLAEASLYCGMLADECGRQHMLLDSEAVRGFAPFVELAALRKRRPTAVTGTGPARRGGDERRKSERVPFITFYVGGEQAAPLSDITEILPYPGEVAGMTGVAGGMLGLFQHRRTAIPLVCLAARLGRGRPIDPRTARVLLVQADGRWVGFVVEALHSIEQASSAASSAALPVDDGQRNQPLVMVGNGEQRRLLPRLDLVAEASAVSAARAPARREPAAAEPERLIA